MRLAASTATITFGGASFRNNNGSSCAAAGEGSAIAESVQAKTVRRRCSPFLFAINIICLLLNRAGRVGQRSLGQRGAGRLHRGLAGAAVLLVLAALSDVPALELRRIRLRERHLQHFAS